MEIIHLIIDTNILIAEPYYNRSEYKSLEILSTEGHIKLYLPYIVENEYICSLKDKYSNVFKTIENELKKIKHIIPFNINSFGQVFKEIKNLKSEIESNIVKDFTDNFCKKLNVEKLKIKPHHADEVFNKYFKYILPFKDNKDRKKDIPDAFILECVIDIKKNNNNVIMITKDKNVQNTCEKNGIKVFNSIKDFIESDNIQDILTEKQSLKEFIEYLKSENSIENFLKSYYVKQLEYSEIKDDIIPSDDNSGIIEGMEYPTNVTCNFDGLINYGNKTIGIPVFFNINTNVEFLVYKADYYMLLEEEEEYYELSPDERNRHYFEIHKDFLLYVNGTVIIDISNLNLDNSESILDKSMTLEINNFQIMKTINTNENEEGIKHLNMCLSIVNPYSNTYINNRNLSSDNFNMFVNKSLNVAYNNLFVLIFLHIRKLRKYIFKYIIDKSQVSNIHQFYIEFIYKNRNVFMESSNQYPIKDLFDYSNKNNINLNTSLNEFNSLIREAEQYINYINIDAHEVFKYNYAVLHCIKYELFDDDNDFNIAFDKLKELIDADSKIELSYRYFTSIIETKLKRDRNTNLALHIQYANNKLKNNLDNGTILLSGDFYHNNNRILCANYNI